MTGRIYFILAACFGLAAFALAGGLHIIDVSNINWILFGDPEQHWIGWQYFRHTPFLQWPIGLNKDFGMELNNSIVYTDSIPVMAFLFKLLSPILPEKAQYTGIWLMTVYVMQAISSYLLIKYLTQDKLYSLLSTVFFLTASALIYRATGHFSLSAQWILLIALYLYLQPLPRWNIWCALIIFSSLVHVYLLAMSATIFLLCSIKHLVNNRVNITKVVFNVLLTFFLCAVVMYISGYFTVTNGFDAYGYGYYKTNLNSFINPVWEYGSRFLPVLPSGGGDYEGISYLGLGMIIMVIISLVLCLKNFGWTIGLVKKHWIIFTGCIGLTIFSLSNNVMLNNHVLLTISLPESVFSLMSIFRSTGRFIWPVMYLLFVFSLVIVHRKLPRLAAYSFLFICIAVQCFDSSSWFKFSRSIYKGNLSVSNEFNNPFWNAAIRNRKFLVSIPHDFNGGDPLMWAYFASTNGMKMNFGYFSRYNRKIWLEQTIRNNEQVSSGKLDPMAVYIFEKKEDFDKAVSRTKVPVETSALHNYYILTVK